MLFLLPIFSGAYWSWPSWFVQAFLLAFHTPSTEGDQTARFLFVLAALFFETCLGAAVASVGDGGGLFFFSLWMT